MIKLHRLNKKEFYLNSDLIRYVESTPDTLISLTEGNDRIMVLESVEDVIDKIIAFRHRCFHGPIPTQREE